MNFPARKFLRSFRDIFRLNNRSVMIHKNLAAFDFDHTIIQENSDLVAVNLLNKIRIPPEIKALHKTDGWTAFMQGIFDLLYKHEIDEISIRETMKDLVPVTGMIELIKELNEKLNFDVIIISDSNSYFINTWLRHNKLDKNIAEVFTNPACFQNGHLKIKMYHFQEECKLSTKNLCKGDILEDFIGIQNREGIIYDQVVYVGDGINDFCPILRLNNNDLACVRDKFKCVEWVNLAKEGKPIDASGIIYNIKAEVLVWSTGTDILNRIKKEKNKINVALN